MRPKELAKSPSIKTLTESASVKKLHSLQPSTHDDNLQKLEIKSQSSRNQDDSYYNIPSDSKKISANSKRQEDLRKQLVKLNELKKQNQIILKRKISYLQNRLQTNGLGQDVKKQNQQIESLNKKIQKQIRENQQLQRTNDKIKKKMMEVESVNRNLMRFENEFHRISQQLNICQKQNKNLQQKYKTVCELYEKKINNLNQTLKKERDEYKSFSQMFEKNRQDFSKIEQVQSQNTQKQQKIQRMTYQYHELLEKYDNELQQWKQERKQMHKQIQILQGEKQHLFKQLQHLSDILTEKSLVITQKQTLLSKIECQLSEQTKNKVQLQRYCDSVSEDLTEAKKQLQKMGQNFKKESKQQNKISEYNNRLLSNNQTLKKQIQRLNEENSNLHKKIETLSTQNKKLANEVRQLIQKQQSVKEASAEMMYEFIDELKNVEQSNEQLRQFLQQKQEYIDEIHEQKKKIIEEMEKKKEQQRKREEKKVRNPRRSMFKTMIEVKDDGKEKGNKNLFESLQLRKSNEWKRVVEQEKQGYADNQH